MDLGLAIQKHAEWKYKFRAAMSASEPMDAAAISKDNCCEVGKWLHGEAKDLHGHLASHAKCVAAHAAFHAEAGKVAAVINAKKNDEAEHMLGAGTPYAEASRKVGVAFIELKNDLENR
jgi:methyl-accepting chemotaxis protein